MTDQLLRADLHVHSWHSTQNGDLPFLKSRDCYSDPLHVYRTAKARGMDIVTITDHDSINGCLEVLSRLPDVKDFIIGEEVSCRMPDGDIQVHLGVYGITEALHKDIQTVRSNAFEVMGRLREAQVFFSLNHLLHFYRRQVPIETYLRLIDVVPALEVRNGTMEPVHNVLVERLVGHLRRSQTGGIRQWPAVTAGSDAHTLRRVGSTWTEAPGRTADDFLESLKDGLGVACGAHGGTRAVAGDAYGVVSRYCASLFGLWPSDHTPLHRVGCITFSVLSLPWQFLPWMIPALGKLRERRTTAVVASELEPLLASSPPRGWLRASKEQA